MNVKIRTACGIAAAFTALFTALAPLPAFAEATETDYATVGKWRVAALQGEDRAFAGCIVETDNGAVTLRLFANADGSWKLGQPYYSPGKVEGYLGFGVAGEVFEFVSDDQGWAKADFYPEMLETMKEAESFSVNLDRDEQTWTLEGAKAAIDKTVECVKRKGSAADVQGRGGTVRLAMTDR